MIRQRIVAGIVGAGVAVPAMHYWRGLSWSLALIIGMALGAFAFLLVRAAQNLSEWRPRRRE